MIRKVLVAAASTAILVVLGAAAKRYVDEKFDSGEWGGA
jgi:hypothetical protein